MSRLVLGQFHNGVNFVLNLSPPLPQTLIIRCFPDTDRHCHPQSNINSLWTGSTTMEEIGPSDDISRQTFELEDISANL